HNRQFYSVGPSTGLSFASQADSSSSAQGSLKAKSGVKHKRVLVESRAYPGGGQVEVVKDTIGRSSKPLLESVKGTFTGGSIRTVKGGTVRNENDENAGTGLVVKKKKSRGTLESIRWALGDRTNSARKAEKEKEKSEEKEKESEAEQERKPATSQGSVADRLKTRLTIDTHVPREVPLETPLTATVISPMTMTPGTLTGNTTDNESLAAPSGGEKTKWRWTISKKRAKSPGPSLSSTFDRPAHARSNSLDPNALMAAKHTEELEESSAYTNIPPRASSLELPAIINSTVAEEDTQDHCSPILPPRPIPVETAPVDFGFEPNTARKVSTGSIESHAESGTTRKSSIGSLLSGVGENASNTGSFAVRAMRSVRSIASLARLGGWVKGEEDENENEDKKDQGKSGMVKAKKKRRVKKKPVVVEEETTTSGESWEAGALGHDPTITVTAPTARQNLHVKDERAGLGVHRIGEVSQEREREEEQWARGDRRSSSGSSYAAPSTISSGSYHRSRTSRASSGASSDAHTVRSRLDSVPAAPNVPANPGIIFEHHEEALPLSETDDLFSIGLSSRVVCGRPRATMGSCTTSAKSSSGSGRTRIESRRQAGMKGTLGEDSMLVRGDNDGPDSDIPDELQVILAGGSDDEALPSPGMPPAVPLPQPEVPRVVIEDTTGIQVAVEAGSDFSDDNEAAEASEEELERGSRKSFDFTGELGQLKGGSRNSFVEVLVTAFKTPARPGGSGMADQLELSIDSLNVPTVTKQGRTAMANEATTQDEATEAEISFSRAEALAKLTQPMNKKSGGQLNLDFRFGPSQPNVPAKRPQENSADTSLSGLTNATFAFALANLTHVSGDSSTAKRRDASIRFKLDTSPEEIEASRSYSQTHDESGVSQSMSSLGNILNSVASDPFGYNPSHSWARSSNSSHATQNSHQESMVSAPSGPSHSRMLNISQEDPFDYEALMRELDEASSMIEESTQGLERSVARRRRSKRMSVESDRSSFYCRTNAPPVSFHNRGYGRHLGHSQHLPTESGSSLANGYGNLGANAGRVTWARHRPESADSNISERYDQYVARPGLGDKMFQTGVEHGIPLPSIMASPTNSEVSADPQFYYEQHTGRYSYVSDQRRNSYFSEHRNSYAPSAVEQRRMSFMSYDSLVDGVGDERRHSIDMESLYERRGRTNSISSVSVFGDDHRRRRHNRGGLQPGHFRPVSIISMQSDVSDRDDDTMVSMIGGNGEARVRRKSVGSTLLLDASPCFRAEKRAKQLAEARSDASRLESGSASTSMSFSQLNQSESQEVFSFGSILESSPSKGKGHAHATPRPFARPRPPAAANLTAEDCSLERADLPTGTPQTLPPYTRPLTVSCRKSRPMGNMTMSVARNRASALICTEPPDTPPLSIAGSDASSISGGSQSSIDVSKLMGMLGNASSNSIPSSHRARARGQGHRRRSSQLSRSSMVNSFTAEDLPCSTSYSYSAFSNSQVNDSVMIVDPDAQIAELAEMIQAGLQLSDEQLASVTRYCALRNEAIETVERSQQIWQDTDFSRFALSTFTPPTHPSAIKEMIDHSQDTYTTLPTELYKRHHPRYFRSPRISPYPTDVTRSVKSTRTRPESVEQVLSHLPPGFTPARPRRTVQESPIVSNVGMTFVHSTSPAPTLAPLSPLTVNLDPETVVVEEKASKQRITSTVRRECLGSSATTVAKENMGVGMLASPSKQSLRINRPRPKGRSSASTLRTALRI
ncbi:hypothetical protein FRC06_002487, partial [Ceratobasidium sp. 370]